MAGELNEADGRDDAGAARSRVGRRTMIKSAAAVGVGAVTWSAPRIETLGFAPAAAAGTPCIILSSSSDDRNSNDDDNAYCQDDDDLTDNCCGQSFGNQGNIETFTFNNPVAGCTQVVVRTIPLDCTATDAAPFRNPDVGQFAVVISSTSGAGCDACTVFAAVLVASSGRAVLKTLNNGSSACLGGGVDASIACDDPLLASSARLAVQINCLGGVVGCTPP